MYNSTKNEALMYTYNTTYTRFLYWKLQNTYERNQGRPKSPWLEGPCKDFFPP